MSASNDLGQWYKSIPPITRVWFTSSAILPLAERLGLVSRFHLLLIVKPIIQKFQVYFFFLLNIKFLEFYLIDLAATYMYTLLSYGF